MAGGCGSSVLLMDEVDAALDEANQHLVRAGRWRGGDACSFGGRWCCVRWAGRASAVSKHPQPWQSLLFTPMRFCTASHQKTGGLALCKLDCRWQRGRLERQRVRPGAVREPQRRLPAAVWGGAAAAAQLQRAHRAGSYCWCCGGSDQARPGGAVRGRDATCGGGGCAAARAARSTRSASAPATPYFVSRVHPRLQHPHPRARTPPAITEGGCPLGCGSARGSQGPRLAHEFPCAGGLPRQQQAEPRRHG